MVPKGLKKLLKENAPSVLTGKGKSKGFRVLSKGSKGRRLRGVTKLLEKKLWSSGALPTIAKRAGPRAGGHWRGPLGGRMRGKRVDAQLTRLINSGPSVAKKMQHVYRLTNIVLSGLKSRGLEPVLAQRCVLSERHRLGTAADILAFDKKQNQLVLVELKCGFSFGKTAAAVHEGKMCTMREPLHRAADCHTNRHLAQLAATREMLVRERETMASLQKVGVQSEVEGLLMYADDDALEFHQLNAWWKKRAPKILEAIAQ